MKTAMTDLGLVREGRNTGRAVLQPDHPPSLHAPIFVLNLLRDGALVRRITVLAASSEAALFKAREQLDDGETLSFCTSTTKIAIN